MKKRYFMLFFLCLVLLGSSAATGCYAESLEEDAAEPEPTFTVASVESGEGELVEVPILFSNAGKGICGATIRLSYDSALTLTDIRRGSAFSSLVLTKPGNYDTLTSNLLWDGIEEDLSSGEIAILVFQAPAETGTFAVTVRCEAGDIIDGNLNDMDVAFVSGCVTVVSEITMEPDFILPAALTSIEEEAFEGGSFSYVKLSDNVTSIGKRAFANCQNLKHIYIPSKTTTIDDAAFEGTDGLVIHGASGSFAETYANAHGFTFQNE